MWPLVGVARGYSYLSGGRDLQPGDPVLVPLGRQLVPGVVWEKEADPSSPLPPATRLKPVAEKLPGPPLAPAMRRFLARFAAYNLVSLGLALRLVLPPALLFSRARRRLVVTGRNAADSAAGVRLTAARSRVLAVLAQDEGRRPWPVSALARAAGVSEGVVRAMITADLLRAERMEEAGPSPAPPDPSRLAPALTPEQQAAAEALAEAVAAPSSRYAAFLLDGVTGSGKTEVYFEAIARLLAARPQMQVLVMLPEIALTAQWLDRFAQRFGTPPVLWHSQMTLAERRAAWQAVRTGTARVVVGARSSLFLPFARLGLIIVDEEHDPSYKQDEGICYHARDMAVLRAHAENIPVILASATPAVETVWNARAGRYRHLRLASRYGGARLPAIHALDMRRTPPEPGRWLAPPLVAALEDRLARKEQSLLYLNRRGYAPVTLCRSCGARVECPHCASWLVEHRYERRLKCHYCGWQIPIPDRCQACGSTDSLVACGPGVERLAEEVAERLPGARLAVMSSDTLRRAEDTHRLIRAIAAGRIDIVIGTQVIAKGHHFPRLTLVGVVDADLGLRGGDLRAGERSFQQIWQVAGRAGRDRFPGEVWLQSYEPEHPVVTALTQGDREAFYAAELAARQSAQMPPFGRLVALVLSARSEERVAETARALAAAFPAAALAAGARLYGPAPAPIARIAGRHRWRLLLHTPRALRPQPIITDWLAKLRIPASVRLRVDVDPHNFL
ncbi:MAG: primosomal protein N' [Alphaproteobacteria bacterium]|nr:MAG: primosomal protein N' [Alphaproteobacteria bacterium]